MKRSLVDTSRRLRIAFVIPLLRGRGGWPTATTGIIRSLEDAVEPVLVVSAADASAARELFPGAETHVLPEIQPMAGGSLRVMARMAPTMFALRQMPPIRADLIHSLEMFPCGWVGDVLARRARTPHILTAFGTYSVIWHRWPVVARIYSGVLRRAACVCPMSKGTAERMQARFRSALPDERMEIVLQGSEFAGRVGRDAAETKLFPSSPIVLSVGAIKPRKGYLTSLRAFAALQKKFPDARYVIAGGGTGETYHGELLSLIARDGIRNVEFCGTLTWEELDPLYRGASMLVMTSQEEGDHFEGFVFVFLEAGAYGVPVIGTRTGGIPDAIADGVNGFLLPADDVEGIARAMIRLAEDQALARSMGMAGRARAEELTWERYARQQMAVYKRVLSGPAARKSGG
ncbi:MAG: glycosyltransferase family 4 protein [Anaerolineales bacterium]|jgi:glycosyltransferase involved in cell wall biosynthesis